MHYLRVWVFIWLLCNLPNFPVVPDSASLPSGKGDRFPKVDLRKQDSKSSSWHTAGIGSVGSVSSSGLLALWGRHTLLAAGSC